MIMLPNGPVRKIADDLNRRWISDEYFDLIIWYEADGRIHGFQLCYDKSGRERSLTWTREEGFQHTAVDSGESKPTANRSPILMSDGEFDVEKVRREFIARSQRLHAEDREFVLERFKEFEERQRS
jgi:hypothetical protein